MKNRGRRSSRHAAGKGRKPHSTPSEGRDTRLKMMGLSKKLKS